MTDLQREMLKLVLEVEEICKKNNIVYYLSGGSVLGAVRHKGYIPWDDDIDIMMTREAFKQFEKACATDMRDDREIISMMNTPCHTKVTIKYMNKTTSQFFHSQVLDTTGCGISLDIFILDPLPKDEKLKEQHIAEYIVFNELLTPFFMVNPLFYKHVPMYKKLHRQAKIWGKKKVMSKLYQHLFVDEPEESEQYLYRWGQQILIYNKDILGTPRYMQFGEHQLPVPEKTIDFLRATYGDNWIYLPPEAQRELHTSNISPTIAYCNWLEDLDPFLDRPKVLRDFVARKKHNVEKAVPAHNAKLYNYMQFAAMKQLEFELAPKYDYAVLKDMDDLNLIDHVKEYLSKQLSSGYIKKRVFIRVPDNKLALILNAMIRVGDYPKADKIMKLRQAESAVLGEDLQQVRQRIDAIRKCVSYFEDRRLNPEEVAPIKDMESTVLCLQQENPRQINLHRCVLEMYTLLPISDRNTILGAIAAAQQDYPEDVEIAFWAGCLYQMLQEDKIAESLLNTACATSNGYILHQLQQMGFSRNTEEAEGKEND